MNKSLVSKIRRRKSLTQEELAEKAFVTVRTIQRMEAGEDVSSETLKSVSNVLEVTVSDLFESFGSVEKEVELMEYSKEQQRQFNYRKFEFNAIRLTSWSFAFIILSISFLYTEFLNHLIILHRLFIWVFLLCLVLAFLNYFLNVFISKKLDSKYPLTVELSSRKSNQREPIKNIRQLIARRWWFIFIIGGLIFWIIRDL